MNWILKNKNLPSETSLGGDFAKNKIISRGKNLKALLVVLFLVFVFSLATPKNVKAATCRCDNGVITSAQSMPDTNTEIECNNACVVKSLQRYEFNGGSWTNITSSGTTPLQKCIDSGGKGLTAGNCTGCPSGKTSNASGICQNNADYNASLAEGSPASTLPGAGTDPTGTKTVFEDKCLPGNFICYFKMLLIGILNTMGFLFAIAATLFAWVVNPDNISATNTGVLQKQAVKDVWIMVRDLLNMVFILILLFAAFCTIFQVEKWNLKKVWLNILINALLVNFSYPIARFLIDVSNVAFYYFLNHLFSSTSTTATVTGDAIFAKFGAASGLGNILVPTNYTDFSIAYLVMMIVFLFIMGMTLLIIAALFVVRLIALAMLVMFSPIGFVGYIFPATASFADDWWKKLFSYSFFAPIMIFMMAIALRVTEAIGKENMNSFKASSTQSAPKTDATFIADAAFLIIPILILWMGIGVAKKMGIEGADKVVGAVKKGGKALAMMGPGNWAKKNWDGYSKARKSRQDEIDKKRIGGTLGKNLNKWQDTAISKVTGEKGNAAGRLKNTKNTALDEDVKKATDSYDAETTAALKTHLASPTNHAAAVDPNNRKAGVEYMAKYKQLISDPVRKQEHEAGVRQSSLLTAAANPAVLAAHLAGDDVAKTAAIEAHVQQQIANSYGSMKTRYQAVKVVHGKV